jgi:hypothetical protein
MFLAHLVDATIEQLGTIKRTNEQTAPASSCTAIQSSPESRHSGHRHFRNTLTTTPTQLFTETLEEGDLKGKLPSSSTQLFPHNTPQHNASLKSQTIC